MARQRGPAALRASLDSATTPLADLVIDERLALWTDHLHWVEGQLGAARYAAGLIATLPPDQIGRQVLRVADRLGLDPAEVTRAVVDAVSRDGLRDGDLSPVRRDRPSAPTRHARRRRRGQPGR